MTVAETKLALEAGTAGLTLVAQLLSVIRQARESGYADPEMAELLAALPGATFSVAKDLVSECEALRQAFIDAGIDMTKTVSQLQAENNWWFTGKYKLVRRFLCQCNALSNLAGHAIDDFIAVARCRDQISLVTKAFDDARKKKEEIDDLILPDVPVEVILKNLISFARGLRDEVQKFV